MKNFSNLLHPEKRVRFVQANSQLHASIPSTSAASTLNALDLDSPSSTTPTKGEELQLFYNQLLASSPCATTGTDETIISVPSTSKYSCDLEILDMETENVKDNDSDILILHETQSSPNLHSISQQKQKIITKNNDSFINKKQQFSNREIRLFMKAATDNDLQTVAYFCQRGMDMEIQDMFRWTALMCAAAAGAMQVVAYLLNQGANIEHQDYAGRNALELAQRCGHLETKRIIENFRRDQEAALLSMSLQEKCELNRAFCNACQCYYTDMPDAHALHENSMLHMINTGLLPHDGYSYEIPSINRGYQLLKSYGWNETMGLGKNGQGRKYPIKTILKRDTKGFGLEHGNKKSKITHFRPMDTKSVENVRSGPTNKRDKSMSKIRELEKQKEAQLRRMFNDDD